MKPIPRNRTDNRWELYTTLYKLKRALDALLVDEDEMKKLTQHQRKALFREHIIIKIRLADMDTTLEIQFEGVLDDCKIVAGQKLYPGYDEKKEVCF